MRQLAKLGPVPTDIPVVVTAQRCASVPHLSGAPRLSGVDPPWADHLPITVSNPRQGAGESNAIPRIWNPIGRHGLHPIGDHRATSPAKAFRAAT
jgi:hypothetical protein